VKNINLKPTNIFLTTLYLLLATCTIPTHAQVPLKDAFLLNETETVESVFPDIGTIIATILPNVFILSGVILFFFMIFGGFTIITAGGNTENLEKGKQALTGAIIGFVIIFTSYWIIQIIEVITGTNILNANLPGRG
jgi:hypothetical protein